MPIGERVGLSLCFVDGARVSLPADIRWVKSQESLGYLLGVEFAHTPESKKVLQRLVWELHTGTLTGEVRVVKALSSGSKGALPSL